MASSSNSISTFGSSSSSNQGAAKSNTAETAPKNSTFPLADIIGIVIGALAICAVFFLSVFCWRRHQAAKTTTPAEKPVYRKPTPSKKSTTISEEPIPPQSHFMYATQSAGSEGHIAFPRAEGESTPQKFTFEGSLNSLTYQGEKEVKEGRRPEDESVTYHVGAAGGPQDASRQSTLTGRTVAYRGSFDSTYSGLPTLPPAFPQPPSAPTLPHTPEGLVRT